MAVSSDVEKKSLAWWSIFRAHGGWYIGRRPPGCRTIAHATYLDPVYSLELVIVPKPGTTETSIVYRIVPILMLTSWTAQMIPPGSITRDCEELDEEERKQLAQGVAMAESIVEKVRAARRSGLVLPGAMP
jgi:hypothetical protein